MQLTKAKKRLLIILSIIVGIIIIFIFSVNFILATILRGQVNAAIEKNKTEYKISLGGIGGNIFFGNIRLKDIKVKPDSNLLFKIKEGISPVVFAVDAEIPLLRLSGIGIYKAIVNRDIDINSIEIRRANIKLYKGKKSEEAKKAEVKPKETKTFNPDSIYLKNITGLSIRSVLLENNIIEFYDLSKDEVILKNKISDFEFTDFYINKYEDAENLYYLDANNSKLVIDDEEFDVPGGYYKLKIKKVEFRMADSSLYIDKLEFKPTYKDLYKMAAEFKFTKEIYDLNVHRVELKSLHMAKLVREGAFYLDSLDIFGIHVDILKDKRYPFDESKRPKLINQALREMKMPLYIGNAQIHDSRLKYQEKEEGVKELMTAILGDLNVYVEFITSVPDSLRTGKSMKINLNTKFMDKPHLNVNFVMPLNSRADTFFFSGSLGSTKLSTFDKASMPAIGAKFKTGELQSLTFKGSANRTVSTGEMTMLYTDLTGELVKKDHKSTNKFLSWAANVVLKTSNPNHKGKTRVAMIGFDRVMYKGFGNFMWKTLQTGIVNTVAPAGKMKKEEQENKQEIKEKPKEEEVEAPKEEENNKSKKRRERKKKKKKDDG